jgi:hypothetical protein
MTSRVVGHVSAAWSLYGPIQRRFRKGQTRSLDKPLPGNRLPLRLARKILIGSQSYSALRCGRLAVDPTRGALRVLSVYPQIIGLANCCAHGAGQCVGDLLVGPRSPASSVGFCGVYSSLIPSLSDPKDRGPACFARRFSDARRLAVVRRALHPVGGFSRIDRPCSAVSNKRAPAALILRWTDPPSNGMKPPPRRPLRSRTLHFCN